VSDVQFYSALVGFLLPFLTAVVIQRGWSDQLKAIANALLSLVAAVVITYTEGNLDGDHLRPLFLSFLLVFVPSIAAYYGFWRPTTVAPRIEAATGGDPVYDDRDGRVGP
jgi:hypothetical protein